MKEGWKTPRFGDVCDLKKGKKPTLQSVAADGVKPYLVAKYLRGAEPSEFASVGDKNSISVSANEIIIICDGSNSGETFIGFDGILSSTMAKICHGTEVDNRFLMHFLDSLFEKFNAAKTGAAIPHLDLAALRDEILPMPEIAEQRRIVAILDEAFTGVATARAAAEQNRQNARALFESVLSSVDGEMAALGDYVTIKTGKLDANAAVEGGIYPFFTCAREIYAIDNFAFDCEAILLAGNNAVGDFNVKHYSGKFNAYQRTYVITINNQDQLLYRFLYFQMLKSLKRFKEQSVGAGTKFLKLGMIKDLEITLPSLEEQGRLVSTLDAVLEETQKLEALFQRKLKALDELKQSLLRQAFRGQL